MEEIKATKVCTKCGIEKPISDFGKCSRNKDGLLVCLQRVYQQEAKRISQQDSKESVH